MKWRANQMMRDDLAKSMKTRLPKEFYKDTIKTNDADSNVAIKSSSHKNLPRRHSQLRMDDFLTFPDSQQDVKRSGNIIDGAEVSISKDLTEAWQCQARVLRLNHKKVPYKEVNETKDSPIESDNDQVFIHISN